MNWKMVDPLAESDAMVHDRNLFVVGGVVGRRTSDLISGSLSCTRHMDPLPGHTSDIPEQQRPPDFPTNTNSTDNGNQRPVNNRPHRRAQRHHPRLDTEGSTLGDPDYASDPPGYDFYVRKTDSRGRVMLDKDGLRLYRSFRGTSTLESLHQKLTLCFGHFQAGIKYSNCLLAVVRHMQNWQASERNRPDFPQARHYDGRALDMMNELYEAIFGYPKYKDWIPFNETATG